MVCYLGFLEDFMANFYCEYCGRKYQKGGGRAEISSLGINLVHFFSDISLFDSVGGVKSRIY